MKRHAWILLSATGLLASICVVTLAARQQASPPQEIPRTSDVLRVSVDLVQVDATVTDDRGQHVADLSAADFEVID